MPKNGMMPQGPRTNCALRGTPDDARANLDALIVQTAPGLIVVLDHEGKIVRINRACEELCGYSLEELRGRFAWEILLDPRDTDRAKEAVARAASGQSISGFECDWILRDQSRRRILWSGGTALVDGDGKTRLIIACGADITERRQIEQRLRESEERYALALRGANDGIWDWNLVADSLFCSTRCRAILGCEELPEQGASGRWFGRVHPEDRPRLKETIDLHLAGKTSHVELELRMKHRSGLWRWVLVRGLAIRDASGKPYRIAGSLTDITDRKAVEEQLVRGALLDPLTGLANRVLIENRIEHALARIRRYPDFRFAVLFLDLDRFKIINDGLGHMVGDQLLVEFSRRLSSCVRPSDMVARLGGDEFVILLEDMTDPADAPRIALRIQELLDAPFVLGEHEVFTTASIGIAPGHARYRCVADLFRDADAAMYRAKAMGKARYELFDEALHERAMETLRLENDLRRAIDRGEFELHYQPIVRLGDLSLAGFEALVRWRHPDRGLVSPASFIPVMEETGLIVPLGGWVLEEACRRMASWRKEFAPLSQARISVNVSGKQLVRTDIAADVQRVLALHGLPPDALVLEITESVMVSNTEQAVTMLHQLRGQGIHLNVDDFGVGYSSLSQLHRIPLDGLKIDRSFISRIGPDTPAQDSEIVQTILALAKNLRLEATAEGIETALQLQRVRSLGCDLAQGYFFAKPMAAPDVRTMLLEGLPWQKSRAAG